MFSASHEELSVALYNVRGTETASAEESFLPADWISGRISPLPPWTIHFLPHCLQIAAVPARHLL